MFGNKKQKATTRIDSLIGLETTITGNLQFAGGLRVDGKIVGNVTAQPEAATTLIVSEKASIEGEIHVGHLVLNGTVRGPIHASEYLELQSKCQVNGDVHYTTLEMHPGAVVMGQLIHLGSASDTAKSEG